MSNQASTSPLPPSHDDDERLEATMPGFLRPPPPREPDPLDAEATTIRPPSLDDEGLGDLSDDQLGEPDFATRSQQATTSSPASTDPTLLLELAHTVVGIASMGVAWLRGRRHGPAIGQAWIADEEDQANIGDPLARIAARRIPAGVGHAAPDVVDGIDALMGTVNYGMNHAKAEAAAIAAAFNGGPDEEPQ